MHTIDGPTSDRAAALDKIRSWIQGGVLKPGMSLPSERVLADRLAVGRTPLRWAVRRLDEEGLIRKAGTRTRIVVGAGQAGSSPQLLKGAVVLLAGEHFPAAEHGSDRAPGWNYQVIYGALDAVRENGRHTLKLNATALSAEAVRELQQAGVAGVVAPRYRVDKERHEAMIHELERVGIPVVLDADGPDEQRFNRVVPDHERGAYELTRLLLDRGSRRILPMGTSQPHWWMTARLRGYGRAMAEAALQPLHPVVVAPSPYDLAPEGSARRFEIVARHNVAYLAEHLTSPNRPDAIMCVSDESVSFISAACRMCNLEPGRDILIAGYDNFWHESWGRQFEPTPPVATVDKNNAEIGRRMVDALLKGRTAEAACVRVPPQVIPVAAPQSPSH